MRSPSMENRCMFRAWRSNLSQRNSRSPVLVTGSACRLDAELGDQDRTHYSCGPMFDCSRRSRTDTSHPNSAPFSVIQGTGFPCPLGQILCLEPFEKCRFLLAVLATPPDHSEVVSSITRYHSLWCPRRDSNSHADKAQASETCVSTNSTTRA